MRGGIVNSRLKVYQKPPEGTGVTFAEIAEFSRTAFAVPQPAVSGTAPASSPLPAWFPRRARFDSRISHHDALASLLVAQRLLNPSCLLWFDFACADHASNAKRNFIIGIVRTEWSPPGHLPTIPMRTRRVSRDVAFISGLMSQGVPFIVTEIRTPIRSCCTSTPPSPSRSAPRFGTHQGGAGGRQSARRQARQPERS